jgi:hypothetical protein
MLVEIQSIDSEALGAILAGLDALGLPELTNVFARWAFELEWHEIAAIPQDQLDLVIRVLDAGCRSYSMRFDQLEFTKREVVDEVAHDDNETVSDDEPAPDLQTPEELTALAEKARAIIKDEVKKARRYRKKKKNTKLSTERIECQIDLLETDQRVDLLSLIRETGQPDIATMVERFRGNSINSLVTAPTGEQIGRLREIFDALCSSYKVRVGAVRFISS